MDKQKEKLLDIFHSAHSNTQQALRQMGVGEEEVQLKTATLPSFQLLSTKTLSNYIKVSRNIFIQVLHGRGLVLREIANRMGGSSYRLVRDYLKSLKK